MTIRARSTIAALALASLLAGTGTVTRAADASSLDGTAWVLTGLPGRTLVPNSSVTLQFEGGRLAGSDGCNRFSGPYSAQKSALDVSGQLASTQMACPADVTEQARAYVAALTGARSYRITGDRLELLAADGSALATLSAQPRTLAGTAWRATGINNGRQAVSSLVKDTSVTMAFDANGRVSGSSGCNNYSASYHVDGSNLSFGQAAATRKLCAVPAGVMEQEQQFLNALATVATSRIEGDRLELRTATGALAVALSREPSR